MEKKNEEKNFGMSFPGYTSKKAFNLTSSNLFVVRTKSLLVKAFA